MALVIDAAAGAATANSFISEADFITYQARQLRVPGSATITGAACTELEKKALLEAAADLDLAAWEGRRSTAAQALSWPREWVPLPEVAADSPGVVAYYEDDEVPARLQLAQAELAMEFLFAYADDLDLASRDDALDLEESQIDVIRQKYVTQGLRAQGFARFPRVVALIAPLLAGYRSAVREVMRT